MLLEMVPAEPASTSTSLCEQTIALHELLLFCRKRLDAICAELNLSPGETCVVPGSGIEVTMPTDQNMRYLKRVDEKVA